MTSPQPPSSPSSTPAEPDRTFPSFFTTHPEGLPEKIGPFYLPQYLLLGVGFNMSTALLTGSFIGVRQAYRILPPERKVNGFLPAMRQNPHIFSLGAKAQAKRFTATVAFFSLVDIGMVYTRKRLDSLNKGVAGIATGAVAGGAMAGVTGATVGAIICGATVYAADAALDKLIEYSVKNTGAYVNNTAPHISTLTNTSTTINTSAKGNTPIQENVELKQLLLNAQKGKDK